MRHRVSLSQGLQIVWFKRDLRIDDHEALEHAIRQGPVLALILIETALWRDSGLAAQHFDFALECYQDLQREMASLGAGLSLIACDRAQDAFDWLHQQVGLACIHSHMETGDGASYKRDLDMLEWCKRHKVRWCEYRQFGVVRGLKQRKAWASQWETLMRVPRVQFDPVKAAEALRAGRTLLQSALIQRREHHVAESDAPFTQLTQPDNGRLLYIPLHSTTFFTADELVSLELPSADALGLSALRPPRRQRGGLRAAKTQFSSFLDTRSAHYRGGISSPLSAPEACSRLSVYLSYGCISMRELVQETRSKLEAIGDRSNRQYKGLEGFLSRLHWHCHFIQKLETEPEIEFYNMHRGYDGLRESYFDQTRFEALKAGKTGWPMVDACVRMLGDCGWLNFRMRAMLVSVASYPLWLHWRQVGQWLAQGFLDFEPGIHWSQMQMQSGTTGINTTRVYNPIKQAHEHDPLGIFVRRWLPAIRSVPEQFVFEPWLAPARYRQSASEPIIDPIVDLARATREAKAKVHALRAESSVIAQTQSVLRKHASAMRSQERYLPSRKGSIAQHAVHGKKGENLSNQLSFDFE